MRLNWANLSVRCLLEREEISQEGLFAVDFSRIETDCRVEVETGTGTGTGTGGGGGGGGVGRVSDGV